VRTSCSCARSGDGEIADGCVVRMARRAVAGIVEPEKAEAETAPAKELKSPEMGAETENPS